MSVVVAHVRDGVAGEYVGRAVRRRAGSPLGNPYRIGSDGSRAEVIEHYRQWVTDWADNALPSPMHDELDRLVALYRARGALTLLCWCSPAPCHADVLAEVIQARAAGSADRG